MQRDNAAHRPAGPDANGPANDSRDSPLNRLLRKPGSPTPQEAPADEPVTMQSAAAAPLGKSQPVQTSAPATPVNEPNEMRASAPQSTGAKARTAVPSPAEMLVNKLRGRHPSLTPPTFGGPLAARPATGKPSNVQDPAPEVVDEKPVDAEFTPIDSPASAKLDEQGSTAPSRDTLPLQDAAPATANATPTRAPEAASKTVAWKPLDTTAGAPDVLVDQPAPKPESTSETPAGGSFGARNAALQATGAKPDGKTNPAPDPAIEEAAPKRDPRSEAPSAQPAAAQESAPQADAAKLANTAEPLSDSPIDALLPKRQPAHEMSTDEPLGALGSGATAVGRLRARRAVEPDMPDTQLSHARGTAVVKSAGKLLRLPNRTRDEREFLPAALEIVDTPPSPVGRAIGFTIILVAVIAISWACIGQVDIVATASGRIVPEGKVKIVQPADTGIVTAIHVADGDHVKAGDVLIELNSTQSQADRDRFVRDLLQANLSLARLRGLAATLPGSPGERRKPNLVDPPKEAKPEDLKLTLAAMRAQAANETAKLADLDQQIEAKQAEAAEAAAATQKLQASLPMLASQEKLLRTMRDQKIGSKLDWFQVNQQLIEQEHEIEVLSHRKDAAEAAQRALQEQRAAEAAQYQMSVLAELDKTRAQASELEAELAKSSQRLSQNVLFAPIDGTVQQLSVHTIGGVVTPAESLMAIVPDGGKLVVEAAVQNRDVGFISAGQPVRVKVEAFNFTLYGLIDGTVLDITRDAVSHAGDDNKGGKSGDQNAGDGVASDGSSGPVYLARIALSQDWMVTENGKVNLTPGMAVTAEIQTGERRLISYLLSPVIRRVSESMHER
ncbi:MAG: HlyD family type I secretion periplasmic adaptor subunit [Dongiaceae bacterium]